MTRLLIAGGILLAAAAVGLSTRTLTENSSASAAAVLDASAGPTLRRFASAQEFQRYVAALERRQQTVMNESASFDVAQAPAAPAVEARAAPEEPGNPEITNNQTVGVDEGGIVKQIGRHLVILQDGRLFSAALGERAGAPLRLADRIDVYRSPENAASWYDEMLVLGDRILVTAYNYREQASEITVVRMAEDGRMTREGRFLLSSNDYYSTENYATRLVGDQLVFYAPLALDSAADGGFRWPRLRRADGDRDADRGEALIGPTDVYAAPGEVEWPVLHTISVCPLRQGMDCRTTAFIGPPMREFYVSPNDAFLWIGAPDGLPWGIEYGNRRRQQCAPDQVWMERGDHAALLYRLPLDGGPIGAVAADGIPADQFAFDSRDGRFRALLARHGGGCLKQDMGMPLALLDIPLAAFDARIRHVADVAYTGVPPIGGQLENRFVGDWLVYGGREGWSSTPEGSDRTADSSLVAVPLARPAEVTRLLLPHNTIRIERAGDDAVVTGYRDTQGLSLSYVSLGRAGPRLAATTVLARRFESEGRSHAFNAWIRADGSGLIGIPTTTNDGRSGRGWSDSESSELSFIAVALDKALTPAGELGPGERRELRAYRCEVSCVDWYGNSRPIFTGGRIFALMGTDLVEGTMAQGRIRELARLDLTGAPGSGSKVAAR
ncbi:MAG: beta-propeller domain-containing protein [Allosphingosinicella sp.]